MTRMNSIANIVLATLQKYITRCCPAKIDETDSNFLTINSNANN